MGEIYGQAADVMVWLGKSDHSSRSEMVILADMCENDDQNT